MIKLIINLLESKKLPKIVVKLFKYLLTSKTIKMEVIVFQKEAYEKLQDELFSRFHEALRHASKTAKEEKKEWLDTQEAKQLLKIKSKSGLQKLRDQKLIVFSKYGRIIQYSRKSILQFIEKNSQ